MRQALLRTPERVGAAAGEAFDERRGQWPKPLGTLTGSLPLVEKEEGIS